MSKYTKQEIAESMERLRDWIKPGDTVCTIVRSVSRSGMSRAISVIVFKDGHDLHPNHAVSRVLGESLVTVRGYDAIRVNGCGMDMCWDLVHRLSWKLYGDGGALKYRGL